MLDVGQRAPDFTAPAVDDGPTTFTLSDALAAGPLVLVFFPGAFTGTCSSELRTFQDRHEGFTDLGVQIVGISVDSPLVLAEFREREGFAFPLVSDFDREVVDAYGVSVEFPDWGVDLAGRAVIVVDRERRVKWTWMGAPGEEPDYDAVERATSALV